MSTPDLGFSDGSKNVQVPYLVRRYLRTTAIAPKTKDYFGYTINDFTMFDWGLKKFRFVSVAGTGDKVVSVYVPSRHYPTGITFTCANALWSFSWNVPTSFKEAPHVFVHDSTGRSFQLGWCSCSCQVPIPSPRM